MDLSVLDNDILSAEGFKSSAYMDSQGLWTIGYGTLIDKRLNAGLTTEEGKYLYNNRRNIAISSCNDHFSWFPKLSDARQRALVEMCYQLGISGLLKFINMLIAMQNYNFNDAAIAALDSEWAKQCPQRAARVAGMIKNG